MFGFKEKKFKVLKTHKLNKEDQSQLFEIREQKKSNLLIKKKLNKKPKKNDIENPYITVLVVDDNLQVLADYIFLYDDNESNIREKDWQKLISDPDVKLEDLECNQWIEDHSVKMSKLGIIKKY